MSDSENPNEISGKVRESAVHLRNLAKKVVDMEEETFKDAFEFCKATVNDYWVSSEGRRESTGKIILVVGAIALVSFCAGAVVMRMVGAY